MENVPADQRYLAARRAVLRQAASEEKVVRLLKVATDDNPADIFTKPLEGAQFLKLRAIIMGVSDLAASAPLAAAREPDVECVHFLAGLEADSSSCELRGDRHRPVPGTSSVSVPTSPNWRCAIATSFVRA